jgi:hypothetical protein
MVTRDTVLKGGFFTVTTDKGRAYCYEVSFLPGRGRLKAQWFVRYATETQSWYFGRLDMDTGAIERTSRSQYDASSYEYKLADRVFRAVFGGRMAVLAQHGFGLRTGTPADDPLRGLVVATPEQLAAVAGPTPTQPAAPPAGNSTFDRKRPDPGTLVMLQYDIPLVTVVENGRPVKRYCFPNPSWALRKIGFRVTFSVWAVQESRLPWPLLDEMQGAGVKWRLADFSEKSVDRLLQWAVEYFAEESKRGQDQLAQDLANAETEYNEGLADETVGPAKVTDKHKRRVRHALKRAQSLAADLAGAARNLGITVEEAKLNSLRERVDMAAGVAQARAACYADAVRRLAEAGKGEQYLPAARAGDVPAGVLADILEDAGADASDVRSVFSDEYDLTEEHAED